MKQLTFYAVLGLMFCVAACAALQTKVGPKAAAAINAYCTEPLASRQALRAEVNSLIAPNQVRINCQGDPADDRNL